jgi:dTDP-4-dehydrorhamnose reductase
MNQCYTIVANTSYPESLARIFDRANGKQFDYVFNCGGETRFSQEEEVYKVRSLNLALALGKEATKRGVKAYVELSTGMVYDPKASPRKETDKLKPWSRVAGFKLQAEDEISRLPE